MNRIHSYIFILSLLGSLALAACSSDGDEPPTTEPANRTVLVYMMAENSLSHFAEGGDIEEMVSGASSIPDNDHLIVFVDDANASRMPRIYEIKKASGKEEAQAKTVKEYAEEVCSADPAVLQEVLRYVKQNYPAKGYGLVMWSHGRGWLPAQSPSYIKDSRTIGIDNEKNTSSNSGAEMEITALGEVLAGFGRLDFLYFDACYMQGIEVAYELRNVTDYLIGCPAETPGPGARYDKIIAPMFATTANIQGIVMNNYNYYASIYDNYVTNHIDADENFGSLMSAIKCDELDLLADLTAPIITREAASGQALPVGNGVQTYRGSTSFPDFYDLCGTIYSLCEANEYETWRTQFDKAVICRVHTAQWYSGSTGWKTVADESVSPYGGVSMYVPKSSSSYDTWNAAFRQTGWYRAVWNRTGW